MIAGKVATGRQRQYENMYGNSLSSLVSPAGTGWFTGVGGVLLFIIIVWSLIWKGLALWKSAREGSKVWFVILLIVNTVGILEILYLYVFSKRSATAMTGGGPKAK